MRGMLGTHRRGQGWGPLRRCSTPRLPWGKGGKKITLQLTAVPGEEQEFNQGRGGKLEQDLPAEPAGVLG